MPKRATRVVLSEKEQEELTQISKRHRSEQQMARRARMVLAAAQGHANAQIARELAVNVDTVRLLARSLGGLTRDRPGHVEHRRALAGCSPTRGAATDHGRTTLSDGGVGVRSPKQSGTPDQPMDGARNCRRNEGTRHR